MKMITAGIKNEFTNYRLSHANHSLSTLDTIRMVSLNLIFYQDHLLISSIETSLILLLSYRCNMNYISLFQIHRIFYILSYLSSFIAYIIYISKTFYSSVLYNLLVSLVSNPLCTMFILFT